MRMPLEAEVNCPQEDIVGVLNQLERLTPVKYCHLCFGVSKKCRCSNVPHQTPSQALALWTPPTISYVTMASSTETMASSSVGGVPPPRYPPPGLPPVHPALMDTLPASTSENLLATAGVGRGGRGLRQPWTPTAPGLHPVQSTGPQQWMPTPGRHEAGQVTPYWQQVYPPQHTSEVWTATTKASTIPSTSQGRDEMARGGEDARGRSSSRGPQGQNRRDRSSTRGSRKCRRGIYSDNPMDDVSNYVASGWKRDLTRIISCYWADQVGPLDGKEWEVGINRFVKAMKAQKDSEWVDIKELTPVKFMPYIAKLFRDITGRDLKGLGDYMGWVGLCGYYHWKLSELGQLSACPHLQGQPVPDGPIGRPSDDLYVRLPKLGLQHLEPLDSPRAETNTPLTEAGKHPPPTGAGNRPL